MAALRDGTEDLRLRLRSLCNAGTVEYTVNGEEYWTDYHIQDVLDRHVSHVIEVPLYWRSQTVSGGSTTYLIAQAPYTDWETVSSGTANFYIQDSTGTVQGTANWSANYDRGEITFTSDQGGTAYYLTGYSFDLYGAAVEIWEQRIAHFSEWYDFSADNQRFTRSQAYEQARQTRDDLRRKAGSNLQPGDGSIKIGQFVRMDMTR